QHQLGWPLTPIDGVPLLDRLFSDLAATLDRASVLMLAGHGGDRVASAARDLAPDGFDVEVLIESKPLGTAGALHALDGRLAERFAFVCGDILTSLDWRRFLDHADARAGLGTLLVHRSTHPEDSDLVMLDDAGRAVGWSRRGDRRAGGVAGALGNAGLAVLHRDILRYVPRERPSDLFRDVMPGLVDRRAPLYGYRTSEYVRDMGTPGRLVSVAEDVASGRIYRKAELVLLDRDGVINREDELVVRPEMLDLIPGSARGIARLNRAGIRVEVVTNQSILARGLAGEDDLGRIHGRLRELLAAEGARLDRIRYCPHHPETHHGEGVEALRGPSRCRKPSTGMVDDALDETDIPAWRALVIGDRTGDMQLAVNAGLASIGVQTRAARADGLCPAPPVWTFPDLDAATRWLTGAVPGADGAP
ncbi:MAG: HAD-IIIA family hydrolase, partial [Acidobacteriota bacterium]